MRYLVFFVFFIGIHSNCAASQEEDRYGVAEMAGDVVIKELEFKQTLLDWFAEADPFQIYLGHKVNHYGRVVDQWFGVDENFEFNRSNRLELVLPLRYEFRQKNLSLVPKFKMKFYMPRTQKKLHLYVDSIGEEVTLNKDQASEGMISLDENNRISESEQVNLLLALRRSLLENPYFNASADVGVRFTQLAPDPVTGFLLRYTMPVYNQHSNFFAQKLYWQRSKGKVFDQQYRHDWLLNSSWLFRAQTGLTWWNKEHYWDLSQRLTWYQSISPYRSFSYSVMGNWSQQSQAQGIVNQSYGFSYSWREKVYSDWFYAVLTPYGHFAHDLENHRNNKYDFIPSITFSLEAHFFERAPKRPNL